MKPRPHLSFVDVRQGGMAFRRTSAVSFAQLSAAELFSSIQRPRMPVQS